MPPHRQLVEVKISLGTPFEQLPEEQQKFLLYGDPSKRARSGFKGILAFHKHTLEEVTTEAYREYLMQYMSATPCPLCLGRRLRPESLANPSAR